MKRHEARKRVPQLSDFDGGRLAGHGCLEGNYSEESGGKDYEARYRGKPWKTGTTKEDREPSEVRIIRPAKVGAEKKEETVKEATADVS